MPSIKNNIAFLFILISIFIASSCSNKFSGVKIIRIKGSDTMLALTRELAAEYMKISRNTSIYVDGGGTAIGAKALSRNEVDICTASRKLLPSEVKDLAQNFSRLGMSFLIGKDALSIYLNLNNPIDDISYEQLRSIFSCEINNWKEIEGDDAKIFRVLRPNNSGTYAYFKRRVLETDDFCKKNSETIHSTLSVMYAVSHNRYAIGYGGVAFHDSLKHAKINGIEPSIQNILNDKYPIIRYLYFYTLDLPFGETKKFIDFVLSAKGQEIVARNGFVAIW